MNTAPDPGTLDSALGQAARLLRGSARVAVLTGAGVSAESGVATFRGGGGLWEGHSIEDVATPMGFQRDPSLVWRFYNARRVGLRQVKPNPGHHALKDMEDRWGSENFTVITQNVDGLHRLAGSRNVLEVHGTLTRIRCSRCPFERDCGIDEDLPDLPSCEQCGQLLRPAIVWFHEGLPEDVWRGAAEAVARCDCMLVAGTSAVVYPAAGLIDAAREFGAGVIEVNLEATAAGGRGAIGLYGPSGEVLPRLLAKVREGDA